MSCLPKVIFDHACMHALDQFTGRKLFKRTPLCVAPISVDRQLDLGELESANDLFKLGAEARVVKIYQTDEFSLQGDKSLDSNGTQDNIGKIPSPHGRASSS
jgi:hypothetical protein